MIQACLLFLVVGAVIAFWVNVRVVFLLSCFMPVASAILAIILAEPMLPALGRAFLLMVSFQFGYGFSLIGQAMLCAEDKGPSAAAQMAVQRRRPS
ncbi:hypothetical protein [Afifella sp. IM 167]|uniref:hypothetical protein n=1 Tax=Afifella sp. IM 167 TaxID=2033586 RepID=UPI001CCAB468|nr:hypothetical protein [Afifella sp. IM 167]MBZ8133288.1 hypothetical protein [Afifella sp. IM 167]